MKDEASSSPPSLQCGSTVRHIQMDPEHCKTQPSDCDRIYELYVPETLCAAGGDGEEKSGVDDGDDKGILASPNLTIAANRYGSVPLVFGVHCYGCGRSKFYNFKELALEYGFVLVLPEGLKRSWNGGACCGYARDEKIDDTGFLATIIDELVADQENKGSSSSSSLAGLVRRDMVYGVGHSNGGFMVTYAARLFRSIAPISGYQYGGADEIRALTGGKPTGLFLHHSRNDHMVSYDGCCLRKDDNDNNNNNSNATGVGTANKNTKKTNCCCGISEASANTCTSAETAFDTWARDVNHCGTDGSGAAASAVAKSISYANEEQGVECVTAGGDHCQSNLTMCVYERNGHFPCKNRFRLYGSVADYFSRDACLLNNGSWDSETNGCACREPEDFWYCSGPGGGDGAGTGSAGSSASAQHESAFPDDSYIRETSPFFPGSLLLTGIGIALLLRYYYHSANRQTGGWRLVPSDEPTVELEIATRRKGDKE